MSRSPLNIWNDRTHIGHGSKLLNLKTSIQDQWSGTKRALDMSISSQQPTKDLQSPQLQFHSFLSWRLKEVGIQMALTQPGTKCARMICINSQHCPLIWLNTQHGNLYQLNTAKNCVEIEVSALPQILLVAKVKWLPRLLSTFCPFW